MPTQKEGSIHEESPADIQFQPRAPRTCWVDINDTEPEPSVSVFHSAWKEQLYRNTEKMHKETENIWREMNLIWLESLILKN